ncbi:trehalose operon repressor [uncultured Thomasclavelia sp.]|uniref:trehalose operon repressor n=1 Tax=uncultured Thomasclavelia sp. TaxID=3025759 RepID=UPI0025F86E9F|nr:trehalose operon repressor [uncultured Thomasclavelia sp.]
MSKYQSIFQHIRDEILNGTIEANTYLPSESELQKEFNASRDTIRKALDLLLRNGYIQKEKGKGSLVLDVNKINFPVSGVMSFKELQATMNEKVVTYVHKFVKYPVTPKMKKELYMDEGDIYEVVRIREFNGEKVILDTDYLNAQVIPGLELKHAQNSLYEYIEGTLGLKVSFAKKEIVVVPASDEEKALLDMHEYDLLVCVKSYTYLDDATLFQYTESKHRPDKFRFVDFARRTP